MEERFTPRMYLDWYVKQHGIDVEDIGVAPVVVVSWTWRIVQSLTKSIDAKIPEHWFYGERNPLYLGKINGQSVSFVLVPVGAPGTIMFMEEMITCGAKIFIGIGFAGSLQPKATIGTFLIPNNCMSEEGTSSYYIDTKIGIKSSSKISKIIEESCKEEGIKTLSGAVWTTDAPYREFISKIEKYHKQGVLGVDMETSAMYTLGKVRGVDVCNLLVVSDELWIEWNPAFGTNELRNATKKAERVILRCLTKDLI